MNFVHHNINMAASADNSNKHPIDSDDEDSVKLPFKNFKTGIYIEKPTFKVEFNSKSRRRFIILQNVPITDEMVENLKLCNSFEIGYETYFNCSTDRFPDNIEHMYISCARFNQPFNRMPTSLKELYMFEASKFNQSLDNLNINIENIDLTNCESFNQPLDYLPPGVKNIILGGCISMTHPLENLPPFLESIEVPPYFDYPIDNFPNSLKFIEFGAHYTQRITKLPSSIEKVRFSSDYIYADEFEQDFENVDVNYY